MQDPSTYQQIKPPQPQFPEHEHLKCPRCESTNTKFCYYNNYNLLQPRHFCKNCRRYWTKGGTLRNIPVGGGTRKNSKRSSNPKRSSSSSSSQAAPKPEPSGGYGLSGAGMVEFSGGFGSLLESNGQFGNLLRGLNPHAASGVQLVENPDLDSGVVRNPVGEFQSIDNSESFLGDGNGWPDLVIYTPGSGFQ